MHVYNREGSKAKSMNLAVKPMPNSSIGYTNIIFAYMGEFLCREFEKRSSRLQDMARGFCRRRRRRQRRCCRLSTSRQSSTSWRMRWRVGSSSRCADLTMPSSVRALSCRMSRLPCCSATMSSTTAREDRR